jgi:DNA invertase Pin-like site-specific DNA recombinase
MSIQSNGLIPAVGYYRCSTDRQETSIEDQQAQVRKYAAEHGYRLLREYADEGISGDADRPDFQRMHEDAIRIRDFQKVIVWDQSRYSREDPIDAIAGVKVLRDAGVGLVTVNKGPIDWSDFSQSLNFFVDQHRNHQHLLDHSNNVVRGQITSIENGGCIGKPPYAYKFAGEKKHKRLEIKNEREKKVAYRIFHECAIEGRSFSNIANRLNAEGIPSPTGCAHGWRYDSVRVILENPVYCGDYVAGKYSHGKYHRSKNGRVVKSPVEMTPQGPRVQHVKNPRTEWIIRPSHHEAIVTHEMFDKAQEVIAKGKTGRMPYTPENNPYIFGGGILRCGKCGNALWGDDRGYKVYICDNRCKCPQCRTDKKCPCGDSCECHDKCEGTTVREDLILKRLGEDLPRWLGISEDEWRETRIDALFQPSLKHGDIPASFAKISKLLYPNVKPKQDRKRLEKRLSSLKALNAEGRSNLILVARDFIPDAQDKLREQQEQIEDLQRQLNESKPPDSDDMNRKVLEVYDKMFKISVMCWLLSLPDGALQTAHAKHGIETESWRKMAPSLFDSDESCSMWVKNAPIRLRSFLHTLKEIVVHTEKTGQGVRTRHTFVKGEIVLVESGALRVTRTEE